MKKVVSLLFALIFLLCSFGFTSNGENIIDNTKYSHAVLNEGNSVTETFAINLNKMSLNETIKYTLLELFNFELENIISEIGYKISTETEEIKQKLDKQVLGVVETSNSVICLKITYLNFDAWKYFSNSGNLSKTVKRLYTYDYYDQKGKVGGLTNLGGEQKLIGEYLQSKVFNLLDTFSVDWRGDNTYLSSYTYITSLKRRHSSADSIIKGNGNYYYHQWLENKNTEVVFWTTRPILVTWYITALVAAILVMLVVYTLGYFLEKRKKKTEKIEGNQQNPLIYVKIENDKTDQE